MNLYKISQTVNTSWDTYSVAIVAAETPEAARRIHPSPALQDDPEWIEKSWFRGWAHPDQVQAEYIGEASPGTAAGVILASFNAG